MRIDLQSAAQASEGDPLTKRILASALLVHRELGPGFLQSIYEEALAIDLRDAGFQVERQKIVPVYFREHHVGEHRLDFLINKTVILELKAVAALEDRHIAVMRSYLNATGCAVGLLLNYATPTLTIKRVGRRFTPQGPVELHA